MTEAPPGVVHVAIGVAALEGRWRRWAAEEEGRKRSGEWIASSTSALSPCVSMLVMLSAARRRARGYEPVGRRARVWDIREWMTSTV